MRRARLSGGCLNNCQSIYIHSECNVNPRGIMWRTRHCELGYCGSEVRGTSRLGTVYSITLLLLQCSNNKVVHCSTLSRYQCHTRPIKGVFTRSSLKKHRGLPVTRVAVSLSHDSRPPCHTMKQLVKGGTSLRLNKLYKRQARGSPFPQKPAPHAQHR